MKFASYGRQAFHDRRRIVFALAMNLAAGSLGHDLLPDPLPVKTEIFVVVGFLSLIPLFTAKYRSKRHWIEIAAIGNFIVTFAGFMDPSGFFGWHDVMFMLTLQIPAYGALVFGLGQLIYGHWSDAYVPRRPVVVETRLRTRLPLADLWYGIVPTPGFADRNPDREVMSIEYADATKTVVRLVTWVPSLTGAGEVLIHFDEVRSMQYVRFRMEVVRGTHDPAAEGESELFFADHGGCRSLRLRHRVNGFTPRRAILGYFDDTFGRLMTARLEAIEARATSGRQVKSATGFNSWFEQHGGVETRTEDRANGYRPAYGRSRSDDETRVLRALGKI